MNQLLMIVPAFMRDVFETRKTLTVDWANVFAEYRSMAAEVHKQYAEDHNKSPHWQLRGADDVPPHQKQILPWVLFTNCDAWAYVHERWRLRGLIGVDFFVQLLGE
jgi:hypothetical protein